MSNCENYVSEEDIRALKESEQHIEHVARSRNSVGDKALSVTDTIRGESVTNRTLDGLEELYQNALSNIGYQQMGDYTTGITIDGRNQIVFYDGSRYIYRGDLPHVTTGATLPEDGGIWSDTNPDGLWVDVGDASLKAELKSNSGASLIGTESGKTLQSVITKLSKGYLSESNGDLQSLVNSVADVFIDEDIDITTDIVIPSNTSIKTINGAKIHFKNGRLRTQALSPTSYWADNDDNRQIVLTENVNAGATVIKLQSTSGLSIGDKLVLKNGYCDMWRVLETSNKALFAVKQQPYNSEIVEITSVSNESVGVSPTKYSYPLTPVVYGYIDNENSLPQYLEYNRPSATKLLYSNITIDIDAIIHQEQVSGIGLMSYVDGISLSIKSKSLSNNVTPFVITMSDDVRVRNAIGFGHRGKFIGVQESCRGAMSSLRMDSWKGGGDTPFLAMLMCDVIIDDVNVTASVKHAGASAAYINTCDGGIISNVISKNTPKVVDFSYSRAVQSSMLSGVNVDFVSGGYRSVDCSTIDGVVNGYCLLNSSSTEYTNVLLPTYDCINNVYSNIRRINDMGYGRVLTSNTMNLRMDNIHSPKTRLHLTIKNKENEIAQGDDPLIILANNCSFGDLIRESLYYDGANQSSKSYPNTIINRVKFNGDIRLGDRFNPLDTYHVHTNHDVTIGGSCFAVALLGNARSVLLSSGTNKLTCVPDLSRLVLIRKPDPNSFASVDSIFNGGGTIGQSYDNGAVVTDVYSRNQWVNTGTRGAVKWVLQ